jgi:hypothetical protein
LASVVDVYGGSNLTSVVDVYGDGNLTSIIDVYVGSNLTSIIDVYGGSNLTSVIDVYDLGNMTSIVDVYVGVNLASVIGRSCQQPFAGKSGNDFLNRKILKKRTFFIDNKTQSRFYLTVSVEIYRQKIRLSNYKLVCKHLCYGFLSIVVR